MRTDARVGRCARRPGARPWPELAPPDSRPDSPPAERRKGARHPMSAVRRRFHFRSINSNFNSTCRRARPCPECRTTDNRCKQRMVSRRSRGCDGPAVHCRHKFRPATRAGSRVPCWRRRGGWRRITEGPRLFAGPGAGSACDDRAVCGPAFAAGGATVGRRRMLWESAGPFHQPPPHRLPWLPAAVVDWNQTHARDAGAGRSFRFGVTRLRGNVRVSNGTAGRQVVHGLGESEAAALTMAFDSATRLNSPQAPTGRQGIAP